MKWFYWLLAVIFASGIAFSFKSSQISAPRQTAERTENATGYQDWQRKRYGRIPTGAYSAALAHTRRMQPMVQSRYDLPKWLERGPNNIPGRAKCLAIDPTDPKKYIVATAGGGLWRTKDGGITWVNTDGLPRISFTWVEFDSNDPTRVWASTGENWGGASSQVGDGLYFSSDRGETWKKWNTNPGPDYIDRILVGKIKATNLYVSGSDGIHLSENNGITWDHVYTKPVMSMQRRATGLEDILIAAAYSETLGWGCIYSNDSGKTWSTATGGWGGIGTGAADSASVAFHSGGQIVYLATSFGDQQNQNLKFFKSTDGGENFTQVTIESEARPALCAYSYDMAVDSLDPDHIFVTAVDVWETTDGGKNWAVVPAPGVHADAHHFVLKSFSQGAVKNQLYVATDGGVFLGNRYIDGNEYKWSWISKTQGVASTQFWSVDGLANGFVVGGTQDNGTIAVGLGGKSGVDFIGSDGSTVAIDYNNPNYIYGSTQYCGVYRSTDGGQTSEYMADTFPFAWNSSLSPFVPTIKLDPNDSTKLYVTGFRLFRTANAQASPVVWQNVFSVNGGNPSPSAFALAKQHAGVASKVAYVATNDSRVYRTTDRTRATPIWTAVEDNASFDQLPNYYPTCLYVDPANHNRVFITFSSWDSNSIYRSLDGGVSWTNLGGSGQTAIPPAPVNTIVENSSRTLLHVGTMLGVFCASEAGTSDAWHPTSNALVGTSVEELRYAPDDAELLFAATHGRGIWMSKPVEVVALEGPPAVPENEEFTVKVKLNRIQDNIANLAISGGSKLTFPSAVQVLAGQSEATFKVKTKLLATNSNATDYLYVGYGSSSTRLAVNIKKRPATTNITGKTACVGGDTVNLTVTFASPILYMPLVLTPTVSAAYLADAWPVTVPVGASSVTVPVYTKKVSQVSNLTIWFKYLGVDNYYYLKIVPPIVSAFTLDKSTVEGGSPSTVTGTVKLDRPAGPGNVRVYFSSTDRYRAKTDVYDLVIPSGSDTATVNLRHFHGIDTKNVYLYAKTGEKATKATLEVRACQFFGMTFNSPTVVGGGSLTGTLKLRYPTSTAYVDIPIASDSGAATVSSTVRIPANSQSSNFTIKTLGVSSITPANITATTVADSASAGFLIYPLALSSISVNPTSVIGGSGTTVTGVVYVNGLAGPGGKVVSLNSNRGSVSVPATVTIPAGSNKVYFTVTHSIVRVETTATITATMDGGTKTATLLVK